MPLSEVIINAPISPVFDTWVPPHSSMDQSPALTTLTCSPYFFAEQGHRSCFLCLCHGHLFCFNRQELVYFLIYDILYIIKFFGGNTFKMAEIKPEHILID